MKQLMALAGIALALTAPVHAADISGQYVEARTCDIWTGPCFANAETNFAGKHAVLGWKIDKGTFQNVTLDGLGIVAVIAAGNTLGQEQTGTTQAVLIVDRSASSAQRSALVNLAKEQGGVLLKNIVKVEVAEITLDRCPCKNDGCARLTAGGAKIETRCLTKHDIVCGNESAYYPPLVKGVKARAAVASENSYKGGGIEESWKEHGRRAAYVGTFSIR
jgi:hypothetical protein